MSVDEGEEDEYERRHNPIWGELEKTLKSHGVRNYSIFLHPRANQLFAYVEIESEEQWESIADTEVCRKWWAYMRDIMPTKMDNRPISQDLKEVFPSRLD